MQKDIKNVAVTFVLIGVMLYGGSSAYAEKMATQAENERLNLEKQQREQEAEAKLQAELLLFKN